jgi:hypothetical protein
MAEDKWPLQTEIVASPTDTYCTCCLLPNTDMAFATLKTKPEKQTVMSM